VDFLGMLGRRREFISEISGGIYVNFQQFGYGGGALYAQIK